MHDLSVKGGLTIKFADKRLLRHHVFEVRIRAIQDEALAVRSAFSEVCEAEQLVLIFVRVVCVGSPR